MKVVILKNTTIDLTQDCIEAVEFFKKHNIDLEFTFKSVSIPTAIKPYKTFQGFNPVTGEPQTVHYYGLVNPGVLDPNYDMTVLLWDMDSVLKPTDGAITSFTTDHIQLAVNQWLKDNGKTTNMLTHEIMHNLCVIARSKGFNVVDEMDMTKTGLAFYKNDTPDASDGNYALTFNNLLPFINSLKGTYKYFTPTEVAKWKLKPELFTLLDDLRGKCGFPFIINSGLRTKEENDALQGSVTESSHLSGLAVDLSITDSLKRFKLVQNALLSGITRIGIGKTFIHLDIDKTKPQNVMWEYN